jgi:hypothetical protein
MTENLTFQLGFDSQDGTLRVGFCDEKITWNACAFFHFSKLCLQMNYAQVHPDATPN